MTTFKCEDNPAPALTTDIAPTGDVVLVVGPDRARLRVNSHCLRSASKVFDAMFGPNWNEGKNMTAATPKDVTLEEDDAESMRTTCCVIHHRNDSSPLAPEPEQLLQIAILVNKYVLNVAIKHAAFFWLDYGRNDATISEMGYLMIAAYLFRAGEPFRRLTQRLILCHTKSFLRLLHEEIGKGIAPWQIFRT